MPIVLNPSGGNALDLITTGQVPATITANAGTQLPFLITAASTAFQNRCRRNLVYNAAIVENKDGNNRNRIWLNEPPISSVASVVINGQALDNTANDGWTFNPTTGELWQGDGRSDLRFALWWPKGLQNITVTYAGGYQTMPANIVQAVIQTIQFYLESQETTGMFKSVRAEAVGFELADLNSMMLPPLAGMIADSYCLDPF